MRLNSAMNNGKQRFQRLASLSINQHLAAYNPRLRWLGLRSCRASRATCQLRENKLLKDTGERSLTKTD
jgi:hypothetical protein